MARQLLMHEGMSYLDRGHDGARDDRARDREGNLIPTEAERREEFARRAAREQEEIVTTQLREARAGLILPQGAEMLERVIADARVAGRQVDAWLAADRLMWFELWFLPGSLEWSWSNFDYQTCCKRIQDGLSVPFCVSVYNNGSGPRVLARLILVQQERSNASNSSVGNSNANDH